MTQSYIGVYQWRENAPHSTKEFKTDNEIFSGCPGIWWAKKLRWHYLHEQGGKKIWADYKARGETVPICKRIYSTDLALLNVIPMTPEGWVALGDAYDDEEDE